MHSVWAGKVKPPGAANDPYVQVRAEEELISCTVPENEPITKYHWVIP